MSTENIMNAHQVAHVEHPQKEPSGLGFLWETRALVDVARMPAHLIGSYFRRSSSRDITKKSDFKVLLFPGFGSDQRYLKPLQAYIKNLGFDVTDWGLGFNFAGLNLSHKPADLSENWDIEFPENIDLKNYSGEAGVPYLIDLATEKALEYHLEDFRPLFLVGWSLGGYVAREVARNLEGKVNQVITLGSPIIGGPKYTKGVGFYKKRGLDVDWIEKEVAKQHQKPLNVPVKAIFSKSDKVVEWRSTVDKVNPQVEHIEIDCAHLGMGFNPSIWAIIEQTLAEIDEA